MILPASSEAAHSHADTIVGAEHALRACEERDAAERARAGRSGRGFEKITPRDV